MQVDEEIVKKALRHVGRKSENAGSQMQPKDFTEEDISLLYSLAYSLYEKGEYLDARVIFQRLVFARPYEKKYWMGLGASEQMLREFDDALNSWSMVSSLDTLDPLSDFHAAECYLSLKKLSEMKRALLSSKEKIASQGEHKPLEKKLKKLEDIYNQLAGNSYELLS